MSCKQQELFDQCLAIELDEAETEKYSLNHVHDYPR